MKPTPLASLSISLLESDRLPEAPPLEHAVSIQDLHNDDDPYDGAVLEVAPAHDQKLRAVFDSLDVDRAGRVKFAQVSELLERDLAAAKLELRGLDVGTATTLLFQKAQASEGTLTYAQFHDAFCVTESDGVETSPADTRPRQFADWYATQRLRAWWLVVYAIANVVAFWWAFYSYKVDPALRYSLRIARGGAKIAILNAFLVMLPLLRSLTQVPKRSKTLWRFVPFDDAMLAHKICGSMCLLGGAIHAGAHISNIVHLSIFGQRQVPVFRDGLPPFTNLLASQPVWTGVVLVVISLISFLLAAFPRIRQGRFNLFWYSHVLFGVLLVMMCFHDAASWVVRATSYVWIVPVATLYLIERRFRYAKMFTEPVKIVEATMLDRACAVYLEKPRRFVYRPGMYVLLNCPEVSYHEWHPFTISSAPADNYLTIHMRDAGDWTRAFHARITACQEAKPSLEYPAVYLDGPAGAPAEDFHRYATCICIAGGIGVTPFASILRDVVHRWQSKLWTTVAPATPEPAMATRKIYFRWLTRGQESLRWFEPTMDQIHALDREQRIGAHQYLTSVKDDDVALTLRAVQRAAHAHTGRDVLSGLRSRTLTHVGPPDWHALFRAACRDHAGETVGDFACGPPAPERELRALCKRYSRVSAGGTVFEFLPERFA